MTIRLIVMELGRFIGLELPGSSHRVLLHYRIEKQEGEFPSRLFDETKPNWDARQKSAEQTERPFRTFDSAPAVLLPTEASVS